MSDIEFHFDFLSPYGYFASLSVEAVAERHGRAVDWHPMLLGVSVMKVMGMKPLLATPLKGDYIRRDVARLARLLNSPLGRDVSRPPDTSLVPARLVCWAKRHHPQAVPALVHSLYAAMWARGVDIRTPQDLRGLQLDSVLDMEVLASAAAGQEASDLLRQSVEDSLAKGVFGSPTVVVDGEAFWGFDRLGQVERWLDLGGW